MVDYYKRVHATLKLVTVAACSYASILYSPAIYFANNKLKYV